MTARCLDKSSPRCVLPSSGLEHTCPHCGRVWVKVGGAWWFRGARAKKK